MNRRLLSEWLARAGFSSEPLRWFCGGDGQVVVEQAGRWCDVATGDLQSQRIISSEFTVREGQVVRFVRQHSGLTDALAAARLQEQRDLVTVRK